MKLIYQSSETHISLTKSYPIYQIDLGKMNCYSDILKLCKEFNIVKYVYVMFTRSGIVVKVGASDPATRRNPGERLYRQCGHIDGWSQTLIGPSGNDIFPTIERFHKKTGQHLNRKDILILVRNLTDIDETNVCIKNAVEIIEQELIENYIRLFGETPIGNIDDERHVKKQPFINKKDWDNMFTTNTITENA